jgi:hypothetical protein
MAGAVSAYAFAAGSMNLRSIRESSPLTRTNPYRPYKFSSRSFVVHSSSGLGITSAFFLMFIAKRYEMPQWVTRRSTHSDLGRPMTGNHRSPYFTGRLIAVPFQVSTLPEDASHVGASRSLCRGKLGQQRHATSVLVEALAPLQTDEPRTSNDVVNCDGSAGCLSALRVSVLACATVEGVLNE